MPLWYFALCKKHSFAKKTDNCTFRRRRSVSIWLLPCFEASGIFVSVFPHANLQRRMENIIKDTIVGEKPNGSKADHASVYLYRALSASVCLYCALSRLKLLMWYVRPFLRQTCSFYSCEAVRAFNVCKDMPFFFGKDFIEKFFSLDLNSFAATGKSFPARNIACFMRNRQFFKRSYLSSLFSW